MIIIGGKENSILGKQSDKLLKAVGLSTLDKRYVDSCSAALQELNKGNFDFAVVYGEDSDPRVLCCLNSRLSLSSYSIDIIDEIHRVYIANADKDMVMEIVKIYYRLADILYVNNYEEALERIEKDKNGIAILEDKMELKSLRLIDRIIKIDDKVERRVNLIQRKGKIPRCNMI